MKAIVSEKGRVTIPKRLRDRLGLRPGTVLDFEESEGRLVARKLVQADHLDDLVGILDLPAGVDMHVEDTRGAPNAEATRDRKPLAPKNRCADGHHGGKGNARS